ncbi:MAG: response regulator transcription factor [Nitrospirae bacterium]|nr:response regulator transcription factor [Nitrospirota bacterium]
MNVLIFLSNYLFCEGIKNLLVLENSKSGSKPFVVECGRNSKKEKFIPDIVLVDFYSIDQKLLLRYPDAKVILINTGLDQKVIASLMYSFKIDGLLAAETDSNLLVKALKAVNNDEIWLDNKHVKALLHKEGLVPKGYEMHAATPREHEVIECVSMGLSNKEIASKLCVSEQTVKAHLNRIFKRFNISSRAKLAALATNGNGHRHGHSHNMHAY